MKACIVVMVMALMVLSVLAAFAYPTFDGATGVVTLPTGEIAPQGTLSLAVDHQSWVGDAEVALLRANWGITENLEISVAHTRWEKRSWMSGTKIWQGGLKYQLPVRFADVAIGGSYGHDDGGESGIWGDGLDITRAYLAVSKEMSVSSSVKARLTGGAIYRNLDWGDYEYDFTRPYVGLELMHDRGVKLGVEYRWKHDADDHDDPVSTVLRFTSPEKPVWVEVGTTNMIHWGDALYNQRGFIGIGRYFGGD